MKPFFRKTALFLAVVLIVSTTLTACAGGGGLGVDVSKRLSDFYMTVQNSEAAIEGGILRYAVVAEQPFAGIFANMFNEDGITSQISGFFLESFLDTDENRVFSNDGAATYTYDNNAETFTITIKPEYRGKLFWHDGAPVSLDDLLFAYEVICHPDYDGVRYDSTFTAIEGVEEYHARTADTISGLTISADGYSMTMHYKKDQFPPSLLSAGIWVTPEPRHYYEGIAVADMRAHARSRSQAIGFGPFKLVNVVEGESARLERNENYYKGAPKLEGVVCTVVSQELFPVAMEQGEFDIGSMNVAFYEDYSNPTNYQYLGSISRAYSYVAFKLGHWDASNNRNIPDPNAKMADVNLRRAIAYSHNMEEVGEVLYNGLRFRASTIISPFHSGYQNMKLTGYYYDPDKANQILDDAGYIDIDDCGFRENPDGSKLQINYATMSGTELNETLAQMALQDWQAVGLDVRLATGGTIEFNLFYDLVDQDYEGIDMYAAAWQVAFNPSPSGVWGHDAFFNMTRYTNARLQGAIDNIESSDAWDDKFREEQYDLFQQYFEEDIPAFPTLWRIDLTAVNNRVKNYSVDPLARDVWIHVQVTNDTPYVK